ncbi:MAG TPA: hypothetical protein VH641_01105 [Streptosporangiaceae bacterium]|jgi:hypothetical protein
MAAHIPGSPDGRRRRLGAAVRRAVLRVLVVITLALAGLLVFGLLPGGRDAPVVLPGQDALPPMPIVLDMHPHGPNRPVNEVWLAAYLQS